MQDKEIERILQLAGVASCPIDPPSLQALQELLQERKQGVASLPSVPSMTAAAIPTKTPSYPSTFPTSHIATNTQIVDLLNMHTRMMMDTQREIQALVLKVQRLEEKLEAKPGRGEQVVLGDAPVVMAAHKEEDDEPVPQQQLPAPQQLALLDRINDLYLLKVARLFYIRSHGFVRPMDGGLIFKLIFMVVVMSARMSKSSPLQGRFQISVLFMVAGFFWHTRYLQYAYHFFVKENIPGRLWAGEDIHANEPIVNNPPVPLPPGRPARPAARNANEQQRHHPARGPLVPAFFGGDIPLRNANPVLALLTDVLCLVGSFLLSIFPVWQPVGRRALGHGQQDNGDGGDGIDPLQNQDERLRNGDDAE